MNIRKKFRRNASAETPTQTEVFFDVEKNNLAYLNRNRIQQNILTDSSTKQVSGVNISFDSSKIFNTSTDFGTGNITNNLTDAKLGTVQKIYHQEGSAPTFPAGWVLIGTGTYSTTALNIIYAEWCGGTRVEYWIVQPV